jgi:hypothetical protein
MGNEGKFVFILHFLLFLNFFCYAELHREDEENHRVFKNPF